MAAMDGATRVSEEDELEADELSKRVMALHASVTTEEESAALDDTEMDELATQLHKGVEIKVAKRVMGGTHIHSLLNILLCPNCPPPPPHPPAPPAPIDECMNARQ